MTQISTSIQNENRRWFQGTGENIHNKISNRGIMELTHKLVSENIINPEGSVDRAYKIQSRNDKGRTKQTRRQIQKMMVEA